MNVWKVSGAAGLAIVALLAGGAAGAQDPAPPESETPTTAAEPATEEPSERPFEGRLYFELDGWQAQPVGSDVIPAYRNDPVDPLNTRPETFPPDTEFRQRWRFGYNLGGDNGQIVLTWSSHETQESRTATEPSEFVFTEELVAPAYSGVFDDNLADGYEASILLKTRDLRLSYYRNAFSSPKAQGKWFVGYRQVSHERSHSASYFALAPNLPPIIPPISQPSETLEPGVDTGTVSSEFDGRGAEGGLDVVFPLWKDRLRLEMGLTGAVLRGRMNTDHRSSTWVYLLRKDGEVSVIDVGESDVFDDPELLTFITQEQASVGVSSDNESGTAFAFETYAGLRYRAWKGLEVVGGYRAIRYEDVAREMVVDGVSVDDEFEHYRATSVTTRDRSIGYEGYYLGIAYTY